MTDIAAVTERCAAELPQKLAPVTWGDLSEPRVRVLRCTIAHAHEGPHVSGWFEDEEGRPLNVLWR